jgi:hypothetical protein
MSLDGCKGSQVLHHVLAAVDRGVSTAELREDPLKHLLSGRTQEVVYCSGGEGLKVSREIIQEMARRGCEEARAALMAHHFGVLESGEEWSWLDGARHNHHLIAIIKENKLKNVGGWKLVVALVPEEHWAWYIKHGDDCWTSEYVVGAIKDNVLEQS